MQPASCSRAGMVAVLVRLMHIMARCHSISNDIAQLREPMRTSMRTRDHKHQDQSHMRECSALFQFPTIAHNNKLACALCRTDSGLPPVFGTAFGTRNASDSTLTLPAKSCNGQRELTTASRTPPREKRRNSSKKSERCFTSTRVLSAVELPSDGEAAPGVYAHSQVLG